MNRLWILFLVSVLALTACGPKPEPTLSPAEVQATAIAAAMAVIAQTQAAMAVIAQTQAAMSPTPLPPTETPLPTLTPTLAISPTPLGGDLLSPTSVVVIPPTSTPPPQPGTATCNQPLTQWDGQSAQLTIKNNTNPKGVVTISLFFTTELGQCGYIGRQFDNAVTLSVPLGTFWAGAFVDSKKDFKVFGGGVIKDSGNWSLWVENDSIILKAGCAPNC